jgi:hypothetical protein
VARALCMLVLVVVMVLLVQGQPLGTHWSLKTTLLVCTCFILTASHSGRPSLHSFWPTAQRIDLVKGLCPGLAGQRLHCLLSLHERHWFSLLRVWSMATFVWTTPTPFPLSVMIMPLSAVQCDEIILWDARLSAHVPLQCNLSVYMSAHHLPRAHFNLHAYAHACCTPAYVENSKL